MSFLPTLHVDIYIHRQIHYIYKIHLDDNKTISTYKTKALGIISSKLPGDRL